MPLLSSLTAYHGPNRAPQEQGSLELERVAVVSLCIELTPIQHIVKFLLSCGDEVLSAVPLPFSYLNLCPVPSGVLHVRKNH